jgi:hypothetical protein
MNRRVADWLPPALREGPAGPADPVRLLDAVLDAVDGQRRLLEEDIDQVWQDLFVDSCAEWALPYLGALLGLPADAERIEVAFAVALRRRKGTPAALEDFAEGVTGLTSRVIEGWQVTAWAQHLGHPGGPRPATLDLRSPDRLRVGTPFERARRSLTPGGRWSPRAATVVVWPWTVRTLLDTEAFPLPEADRFALHPLGVEAPLYLRPRPLRLASGRATVGSRTGDERDAPVRATYDVLQLLAGPGDLTYGGSLSLAPTHPLADVGQPTPPLLRVTVGDPPSSQAVPWAGLRFGSLPPGVAAPAPPGPGQVLVDVARGHLQLGSGLAGRVRVTWHRPLAGSLGAFASTADVDPAARVVVNVDPDGSGPDVVDTLTAAFQRAKDESARLDPALSRPGVADVEIRLLTSDRLAPPPRQAFTPTVPRWRIVAPPLMTPTVTGPLSLDLAGACVTLAGFLLGGNLTLGRRLMGVSLDGMTMDPAAGQVLVADDAWELAFEARRCILGPVRADLASQPLVIADSVVDGRRLRLRGCGGSSGAAAVDAVGARQRFGPALSADSVTFAGPVRTDSVDAVDCLFLDGVAVVQAQEGCLRHCYLGPASTPSPRLPQTYRCGPFPDPTFVSEGFDGAGYYRLDLDTGTPLVAAASDGGEVGAYHRSRQSARIQRLRQRVEEFVPLGLRAAVAITPWEER